MYITGSLTFNSVINGVFELWTVKKRITTIYTWPFAPPPPGHEFLVQHFLDLATPLVLYMYYMYIQYEFGIHNNRV